MSLDLDAIKARCEAATPGPWYWGGNVTIPGGIDLRAKVSGIPIVMQFRRWGLQGAEPCFWKRIDEGLKDAGWWPAQHQRARDIAVRERPYRGDIVRLENADAEFIAHSRADVEALVAEVERLRAENASLAHGLTVAVNAMPA